MAVQPDGKIVVVGRTQPNFGAVARLMPNGSPDPSFGGGDGIVIDRRFFPFTAVALQPDGKIVVASPQGRVFQGQRPIVGRYLPDGRPDRGFANGGALESNIHPNHGFKSAALVIRSDGQIVVGGTYHGGEASPTQAVATSISPDGVVTGTFGSVPPPGTGLSVPVKSRWTGLKDLLPMPDGTMIVAGVMDSPNLNESLAPMLAKIGPAFSPLADPSFGGGAGVVRPEFGLRYLDQRAETVIADGDGLILGGSLRARIMLARFDSNGIVDTGFGEDGLANPLAQRSARSAVVNAASKLDDGGIAVVGTNFNGAKYGLACEYCPEAMLGRFDPDGSLDREFGDRGLSPILGAGPERMVEGADIVQLPSGKIVASGTEPRGRQRLLVSRFWPDGALDRSFGEAGIATVTPCPGTEAERRRTRCLPSASVSFQARGLAGSSPALRIQIRPTLSWARIGEVKLFLPPELVARNGSGEGFYVIADGRSERIGVGAAGPARHQILTFGLMNSRRVTLIIPRGCIERVQPTKRGRKLVFGVRAVFESGSKHTVPIRRSP